jgi:hypothetical protein
MILFLFTIMLMNLNKENVHKPRITRLGAIVSLFDISSVDFYIYKF